MAEWLKQAVSEERVNKAISELIKAGFEITGRSRLSLSMRGPPELFERFFSSKVECEWLPVQLGLPETMVCRIAGDVVVPREFADVFALVTIQPPNRSLTGVNAAPPLLNGVHYLNVLGDVALHLRAKALNDAGLRGAGVRLTMIDTGFAHVAHPFFPANGFVSTVVLAGDAQQTATDANGHGTGESANIFAIAPGVVFTGIKIGDENGGLDAGSLLEGLQLALGFDPADPTVLRSPRFLLPRIISISIALLPSLGQPDWNVLPSALTPLEQLVREAVLIDKVVIVASAGNMGEKAFPGQMRHVIAAGGVFVDGEGQLLASDYASAYASPLYPGRQVPDVCGLCGQAPNADYIMLPVPKGSLHDQQFSAVDGTAANDGWARFSGTSASAPQIAAVCALLLEKNPALTPTQVKQLLRSTAVPVNPGPSALPVAALVDAAAAWQLA